MFRHEPRYNEFRGLKSFKTHFSMETECKYKAAKHM